MDQAPATMIVKKLELPEGAITGSLEEADTELTLNINGVVYLLVDHGAHCLRDVVSIHGSPKAFVLIPVCRGVRITDSYLHSFRSRHLDTDDVFQPIFLGHVVFYGAKEAEVDLQPSAKALLTAWQTKEMFFVKPRDEDQDEDESAPGPYILHKEKIWEPWRVYYDDNLAMMISFKPNVNEAGRRSLRELDSVLTANQIRMVVPSRCYSGSRSVAGKPLLGVRIVVKDIFDVQGFKTSLCNRAWMEYHLPKSATAPSVERLQALGAVLVGKTRLNAMVVREECMECVEFLAPFNPRGDGYQTSSGSSSGSCVALSAYPWIDFALGSDTNGSCRKPAYWMACFAIRPTTGVLDVRGVASFCPFYDVPSFFGRDISRFRNFADLWYGNSPKLVKLLSSQKTVPRILCPTDYLPTPNMAQTKLVDSFVQDLERLLGVKRTKVCLAEMWRDTAPDSVRGIELPDYLKTAATLPYYKDACGILKTFVDGYTEKFGKTPFFHRALRWRFKLADSVTPGERDEGWERIITYKKWLLSKVFNEGTVVVLPVDEGKPNNRENPPPPFTLLSGYHPLYLSPIAGTPEVTAPIGEISYYSEVTHREEPLPISVSVVAPPGTDLDLLDLVHKVLQVGERPTVVATGRSIFSD